ncbi:MAG: hypothetical protein O9345_09850 [Burkholderiaceae bacterium]|jgi:hypothetical protein|nr:hypothetical protein [Burkholderiales bacterium]MCZ8338446.1 hypothetical protein [Burkholderiaceae bacterium]
MTAESAESGLTDGGGRPRPSPGVLALYLSETRQLFDSMDPAPFRERDLDPKAVAYIVDWAREAPAGVPLGLLVHLGRESARADDATMLGDAVHEYFRGRAHASRVQLRRLLRTGRVSLVIGLAFLAAAIAIGEFVAGLITQEGYAWLVKESLVIGGWVALWRPLEIFLYDWWPIRADAVLNDRLASMEVRLYSAIDPPAGPATAPAA